MNKNSDSKNIIVKQQQATLKPESGRIAPSKQDIIIKINKLIQRSRQAIRVYGSLIKEATSQKIAENDSCVDSQAISDLQAREWRDVNIELLKRLTPLYENFLSKNSFSGSNFIVGFTREFSIIKELFVSELRMVQADMHLTHRALLGAVDSNDYNKNDYISAIQCSTILVSLKTRIQALEAVCKELNSVLPNMLLPEQNNKSYYLNNHAVNNHTVSHLKDEPLVLTKHFDNLKNDSVRNLEIKLSNNKSEMSRVVSDKVNYDPFEDLNSEDADLVQLLRSKTSGVAISKSEVSKDYDGDTSLDNSREGKGREIRQEEYKSRKVVPLFKKYK